MVFECTLVDNISSMYGRSQQVTLDMKGKCKQQADRYIYGFAGRYVSMKSSKYIEKVDNDRTRITNLPQ